MKLWKKLTSLLLAAALMIPLATAAPSEDGSFPDVKGHWAQAEIEKAVASGWVDGYEDGTFRPERTITRAEFVKMILDATHLTPGCETVEWMKENAANMDGWLTSYQPKLNDMNDHWLTTQGWTEAALYSGMVVPSDYNGGNFRPEKPIARYEIALMVTRALGQVYEAKAEEDLNIDLPFTDSDTTMSWMKGYIRAASEAGVVNGYPDGSFQPNEASTRAEAVVMVQRMLDVMEEGLDPDIHVVVQYHILDPYSDEPHRIVQEKATDAIQLQVVDDVVYASLLDLYQVRAEMMRENNDPYDVDNDPDSLRTLSTFWWPVEQCIGYRNWSGQTDLWDRYQMGDTKYIMIESPEDDFCAPVRVLYGQAMIPIYDEKHPNSEAKLYWQSGWNAETQTLTIPVVNRHPYVFGS